MTSTTSFHIAGFSNTHLRWFLIPILALTLLVPVPSFAGASSGQNGTSSDPDDYCKVPPFNTLPPGSCNPLTVLQQNANLAAKDIQHLLVIANFLRQHPNPQLLKLLLANPKPSSTLKPVGDGTWSFSVPLQSPNTCIADVASIGCTPPSMTVTGLGLSTKLGEIYNSVVFSTDRNAQLQLYTNTFNSLPGAFLEQTRLGLILPTPESLSQASLADIGKALSLVSSNWQSIISFVGQPSPVQLLGCDAEIGSSPQNSLYGDRSSNSNSCGNFKSTGIYANVNFYNKGYATCVKDQGPRGTCFVFGSISAVEQKINMTHGIKVNLSEQDLMEHHRLLWNPGYEDDNGGVIYDLLNNAMANNYSFAYENKWDYNPSLNRTFDANTGVFVNSCLNYPSSEPGCSDSAPQAPGFCQGFRLTLLNGIVIPFPICVLHDAGVAESGYKATSFQQFWNALGNDPELNKELLILNLAFNNTVVIGMQATNNFYNPSSDGYVTYDPADTAAPVAGHVVHVVGAVTNDQLPTGAPAGSGGGYFIVKNSFGNCWGDAGYAYVPFDYVKSQTTDAVSIVSVN